METTARVWTFLAMFVKIALSGTLTSTSQHNFFLEPVGFKIMGLWSVYFELKGCKNLQLGLWGPTKSTSNGYNIELNTETGGQYFSAVRKICSGCPGTPEVEVNQGGSFFTCDSTTYHPYWVSWDQATIKMGKGTVIGEEVVVSWTDPDIIEINYFTIGASDGSTRASINFDETCVAKTRPALSQSCIRFVFQMSDAGKTIHSLSVIFEATGMTKSDCSYKCLSITACFGFSISTTGTCKLTGKCVPILADEAGSNVYFLKSFGIS
ncbi:uncharacterized protein LOC124147285 [Haliotis rufescens]|uniref:uncharacterized protein LOC124147285 n=1 Tax=Haliotis rufescens TaxID=6454 RepID=UPI00201EB41A|nr:uncharacterized protein LOC124147285 [Haliotis rufescens]